MTVVQVINNTEFEFCMLFLIVLSSLQLCFDDVTVKPGSAKYQVLHAFDIFFCVAFGVEVSHSAATWHVAADPST
jgi:hypothetical protein